MTQSILLFAGAPLTLVTTLARSDLFAWCYLSDSSSHLENLKLEQVNYVTILIIYITFENLRVKQAPAHARTRTREDTLTHIHKDMHACARRHKDMHVHTHTHTQRYSQSLLLTEYYKQRSHPDSRCMTVISREL